MSNSLLANVLEIHPDTNEFILNNNEQLFILIREAILISQMQMEIPAVAKTALYQQNLTKQHRCSLEVKKLKDFFFSLLNVFVVVVITYSG